MYDMYPEWGPSRHRQDPYDTAGSDALTSVRSSVQTSVQTGLDLRDNGGQRPDDN
jgi:hypothetical protein